MQHIAVAGYTTGVVVVVGSEGEQCVVGDGHQQYTQELQRHTAVVQERLERQRQLRHRACNEQKQLVAQKVQQNTNLAAEERQHTMLVAVEESFEVELLVVVIAVAAQRLTLA